MQTTSEKQEKYLRRRFHILLGQAGFTDDDKLDLLAPFGVESSLDLNAHELLELCITVEQFLNPEAAELDKLRKRLIASIGAWLRALGKKEEIGVIKAVACRAAKQKHFNRIPKDRLISLYNAFSKKRNDLKFAEKVTREELTKISISN